MFAAKATTIALILVLLAMFVSVADDDCDVQQKST
jgi:hypothetical protein